jgi:hypothetical protein
MPAPAIKNPGGTPGNDGEMNLYSNPEGVGKPWFSPLRRVVFVNGMSNSPEDHRKSALGLSLLQACPVVGIYNKTEGFVSDLAQCLMDKFTLGTVDASMVGNHNGDYKSYRVFVDAAYAVVKAKQPSLSKVDFLYEAIRHNKATAALYNYLVFMGTNERKALKIYAHSQGNLITANALMATALALGDGAIAGIEVNSFGSPCRFWPPGLNRTNYAFTFDPVTWLDYRMGFDNVKVGFVAGHGFDLYRKHDGEFICNRFRWGSFGLTVNMDEQGLADFMVKEAHNLPRIEGIVDRLLSAHWTDSDDVVLLFVQGLQKKNPGALKAIKAHRPSLQKKLIKALDDGWTTSEEYKAMDALKNA